ncbi:apolipoprotein N-acyltransferase [Thermoproteota archaeon]
MISKLLFKHKLTLLSALLTVLVFPKWNMPWLAFFCLIPLIIDLRSPNLNLKEAFIKGGLWGLIVMGLYHAWILELNAYGNKYAIALIWVGFSLYSSIFYAGVTALVKLLKSKLPIFILLPSAWVVFEWLRGLGPLGNTAGDLGYSQTAYLEILQLAGVGGIFFLSFFCVLINCLLSYLVPLRNKKTVFALISAAALFITVVIWGHFHMLSNTCYITPSLIGTAVIQGNHTQNQKLDKDNWPIIIHDYFQLSKQALAYDPDLIIWPETITPGLNINNPSFLGYLLWLTRTSKTTIVFGTPMQDAQHYYNSAVAAGPDGLLDAYYKKVKLMPFGEYLPMSTLYHFLGLGNWLSDVDYTSGKSGSKPFYFPLKPVTPPPIDNPTHYGIFAGIKICLESIYPWYFRKDVNNGATLLIVLANNAWFHDSSAAEKHFQMSVLRAVENNRYLIQAANTGISGIVTNIGKPVIKTSLAKQSVSFTQIPILTPISIYTRTGDWIVYLSLIILSLGVIVSELFRFQHRRFK